MAGTRMTDDARILQLERRRRDIGDKLEDPGDLTVAQVADLAAELRGIARQLDLLSSRGWHSLDAGRPVSPTRI